MLKEEITKQKLTERLISLTTDLYLRCAEADILSFERLCRRIHLVRHKLRTLKGGIYGEEKQ